jgi:hypothetical protein
MVWISIYCWQSTLIITIIKEDTNPLNTKGQKIFMEKQLNNYIGFVENLSL